MYFMTNFRAAHPLKPFTFKKLIFTQMEHKNLVLKGISTSSITKNYVLWDDDMVFSGREASTEKLDRKLKPRSPLSLRQKIPKA